MFRHSLFDKFTYLSKLWSTTCQPPGDRRVAGTTQSLEALDHLPTDNRGTGAYPIVTAMFKKG
jgi:hypothetical protein